ncbi:hypothetical protein MNB_SV-12-1604 [hydrothermal vent metagenome]|uniref:DUF2279 domain-containing protein n=1 Tax=hydrothermal vent metagenome TaxID=652676 RepID=A0A1W1BG83_9ZZZZ
MKSEKLKKILFILLFTCLLNADEGSDLSKTEKLVLTNIGIATGVLTWGFTQWGYGDEAYHWDNEGWFEKTTSNGGSDKLGHFYTNYLTTRIMSPIYEDWGYNKKESALYGSLTSILVSGILIEIGDGYSEHGFSQNDFIADAFGALSGYLWYLNPSLAKKIDFRFEYNPFVDTGFKNQTDFTTDYERMKHLMAIKADGFEIFEDTPLKYFELHLGYYSRNFNHDSLPLEGRERNIYIGLGVNLSKLFRPTLGSYSTLFNFVQVPYSYVDGVEKF